MKKNEVVIIITLIIFLFGLVVKYSTLATMKSYTKEEIDSLYYERLRWHYRKPGRTSKEVDSVQTEGLIYLLKEIQAKNETK